MESVFEFAFRVSPSFGRVDVSLVQAYCCENCSKPPQVCYEYLAQTLQTPRMSPKLRNVLRSTAAKSSLSLIHLGAESELCVLGIVFEAVRNSFFRIKVRHSPKTGLKTAQEMLQESGGLLRYTLPCPSGLNSRSNRSSSSTMPVSKRRRNLTGEVAEWSKAVHC